MLKMEVGVTYRTVGSRTSYVLFVVVHAYCTGTTNDMSFCFMWLVPYLLSSRLSRVPNQMAANGCAPVPRVRSVAAR